MNCTILVKYNYQWKKMQSLWVLENMQYNTTLNEKVGFLMQLYMIFMREKCNANVISKLKSQKMNNNNNNNN